MYKIVIIVLLFLVLFLVGYIPMAVADAGGSWGGTGSETNPLYETMTGPVRTECVHPSTPSHGSATVNPYSTTAVAPVEANRTCVHIFNTGTESVFVGLSGVTVANGYPILPSEHEQFCITGAIYGISTTDTFSVRRISELK